MLLSAVLWKSVVEHLLVTTWRFLIKAPHLGKLSIM